MGVACVTITCCGANMKDGGASGGVNTGGADIGGVSSPWSHSINFSFHIHSVCDTMDSYDLPPPLKILCTSIENL